MGDGSHSSNSHGLYEQLLSKILDKEASTS